jgi:hypothetical protein
MTQTAESTLQSRFARDGYALVRGLAEPDRLRGAQTAIARLVELRSGRTLRRPDGSVSRADVDRALLALTREDARHKSFIYDTLPNLPEVVGLATSPAVMRAVRRCLGLEAGALVSFINVNLRIDLAGQEWEHNLPWHQDYPYRNKLYAKEASAVLWMPVFDCPLPLGPVEVRPGSHLAGEITTREIPRDVGAPHWTIPEDAMRRLPVQTEQAELAAGDALVFSILLVHRSGINRDNDAVRWSLQARYSNVQAPTFLEQYRVGQRSR